MKIIALSPEEIDETISLFKNGYSLHKIANKFNVSRTTISKIIKYKGFIIETSITKEDREMEIINLLKSGYSYRDIEKKMKTTRNTIRRLVIKNKIKPHKIGYPQNRPNITRRKQLPTKNEIIKIYINEDNTITYCSRFYKVSKWLFSKWLKILNVNKDNGKTKTGNWKEKSRLRQRIESKLSKWKLSILKRDNFLCTKCGCYKELEVHHLLPLRKIISEAFEILNLPSNQKKLNKDNENSLISIICDKHNLSIGITLCKKCHSKEDKWRSYFLSK